MLCHKTEVKEQTLAPPPSETKETLNTLCKKCHNARLRFLVLLPANDFQKCFFSNKDLLWSFRNYFQGVLTIENYEDVDALPYTIEEPVMPRQLYIMLPKERIYVPSDQFTGRYIRSKIQELIKIFIALGATSIKYVRHQSHEHRLAIGAETEVVSVSEGGHHESAHTHEHGVVYELTLPPSSSPPDVSHFSDCSFYYLKRDPALQDLILRRIDHGLLYDKYTYWNKERKMLRSNVSKHLQWCHVSAKYDWEKYEDLMVDYSVTYTTNNYDTDDEKSLDPKDLLLRELLHV